MAFDPGSLFAQAKIAYDIAKGINSLKTEVDINLAVSKVLEILLSVQGDALTMQSQHQELLQIKNNLEQKIMEFEKWSDTERQYELKTVAPDTFVYSYKKTDKSTKPAHWLCPKCFQEKKAHILQLFYGGEHGPKEYACPNCNTRIKLRSSSGSSFSNPYEE